MNEDLKVGSNPSHDPGGGGDQTFHQKQTHLPESQQDDVNANNARQDKEEGIMREQQEVGVEVGNRVEKVTAEQPTVEILGERHGPVEGREDEVLQNESSEKTTIEEEETEEKGSQEQKEKDDSVLDFGDPRKLDRQQRSEMYTKACALQQDGKVDQALKYFLASITGLTENNSFHDLPQCLHQVSNIYFEKNEYEKAVHFIQAEKMYYETALIDIVNLQKQIGEKRKRKESEGKVTDSDDAQQSTQEENVTESKDKDPEITKARELENLARLCLKEGKPQLALEYCGKATKIYRTELGDDHPVTVGSLDLFAIIYADVGKKLYEDAIKKFGVEDENEETKVASSQQASPNAQDGSIAKGRLRKRSKTKKQNLVKADQSTPKPRVHFEEYEPSPPAAEQDDWVTTVLLMILFFLVTILFALIFSYFYCRDNERSEMCAELKGDLTYWYMRIQYTYRYYVSNGKR